MEENYIMILRESLEKKVRILRDIIHSNEEQRSILEDDNAPADEFERNVDAKDALVRQIVELDDGFDELFKKVEGELSSNREKYASEIKRMQDLIREITDLSAKVQSQEKVNYDLAKLKFAGIRKQVKKVRQSQKAVSSYYQSMGRGTYYDPQFFDSNK